MAAGDAAVNVATAAAVALLIIYHVVPCCKAFGVRKVLGDSFPNTC